jgi:hypothetical protein
MSKLTGSTIPYAITFGNHDYVEHTRNSVTGNTFFPLSIFEGMSTFGDSYDTNCENTYHVVNIKGNDIFLDIDPIRPLYKFRFLLDIKGLRKMKLKKLS